MPRYDGTGPQGYGPMTGRGMGPCAGASGRFGFGCRRFWSGKNELAAMEDEASILKEELQAIQEEIKSLKAQK